MEGIYVGNLKAELSLNYLFNVEIEFLFNVSAGPFIRYNNENEASLYEALLSGLQLKKSEIDFAYGLKFKLEVEISEVPIAEFKVTRDLVKKPLLTLPQISLLESIKCD